MKRLALAFSALIALTCMAHADSIGLSSDKWTFKYGQGTGNHPATEGGGIGFDFPQWSNQVDYLIRPYGKNIKGKTLTLTGTLTASPDAVFRAPANNCPGSAGTFRFIVQHTNDNLTKPNYRFWSNPASVRLVPGTNTFTLTVNMTSSEWTNVDGQHSSNGFSDTMSNMGNLGLTFVGANDCSFGHGAGMGAGTAHLSMYTLSVN